jgi:hypothetical protein
MNYTAFTAYHKNSRSPGPDDFKPGTEFCWWLNDYIVAWELMAYEDSDHHSWWLPYQYIPDPIEDVKKIWRKADLDNKK